MPSQAGREGLRIVVVSDTGVARGHVYGLRVMSFARVLAMRGHRIVLVSPDERQATSPTNLPDLLATHDWTEPLVVTAIPRPAPPRSKRLPNVVRKAMTAASLIQHGGTDIAWQRAAAPLGSAMVRHFAPQVVWATFGTTSNLCAGQAIARAASAPWVGDLKDNADLYVPRGTRRLLARRFADMTSVTSNAMFHAVAAKRWLSRDVTTVYSGTASAMLAPLDSRPSHDVFLVTLIGSVYSAARTQTFLAAVKTWIDRLGREDRACARFRYAGVAPDIIGAVLARAPLGIPTEITGNVSHAELASLCQAASVNCYIWLPATFHHKALELLACRRPIVAFPGEHPETLDLAARTGGSLTSCGDAGALGAALDRAFDLWRTGAPLPPFDAGPFSWEGQGDILEAVLREAAQGFRVEDENDKRPPRRPRNRK